MHCAQRHGSARKRENVPERGPLELRTGAKSSEHFPVLLQTAFCFRSEQDAVTRHKFEKPQDDGRITLQLRGGSKKHSFVRHGELAVRQARAPVAKLR